MKSPFSRSFALLSSFADAYFDAASVVSSTRTADVEAQSRVGAYPGPIDACPDDWPRQRDGVGGQRNPADRRRPNQRQPRHHRRHFFTTPPTSGYLQRILDIGSPYHSLSMYRLLCYIGSVSEQCKFILLRRREQKHTLDRSTMSLQHVQITAVPKV